MKAVTKESIESIEDDAYCVIRLYPSLETKKEELEFIRKLRDAMDILSETGYMLNIKKAALVTDRQIGKILFNEE